MSCFDKLSCTQTSCITGLFARVRSAAKALISQRRCPSSSMLVPVAQVALRKVCGRKQPSQVPVTAPVGPRHAGIGGWISQDRGQSTHVMRLVLFYPIIIWLIVAEHIFKYSNPTPPFSFCWSFPCYTWFVGFLQMLTEALLCLPVHLLFNFC